MITQELEDNIKFARADAKRRGLEAVTVELLTLTLIIKNTATRELLVDCQADTEGLKRNLSDYLASRAPMARLPGTEPQLAPGARRVLERAVSHVRKKATPDGEVTGAHVLAAVFAEPESYAAYFMQKHGLERLSIFAWLARQASAEAKTEAEEQKDNNDLTAQAAAGNLEKPFGRDKEAEAMIRILMRKYKNNPLLVGEPGVGKTSLAHLLAHRIAAGDAPPPLVGARLLQISIADLVAGTKYRGDFEKRARRLIENCRSHGNTIVFIDEAHTMIGAGAVSGGAIDAANLFKPLLSDAAIRVVGATTFAEYRRFFEKDGALSRRFQKMEVREPAGAVLRGILGGVVARLEAHHEVAYAPAAADAAVELSCRYSPARFLPDKAIDLLDDAGAARRQEAAAGDEPIGKADLTAIALRAAGLPPAAAEGDATLASLGERLDAAVFDQPAAARRLARAVLRARMGFHDGAKTVGGFLFAGPTGVGKTEMARQLARLLHLKLLRYDMSEYMERHAVSRLIGAPPGYVGFEQSGKLTEDIFRHPNAIVLFDEAEKAHPDVLNVLLQILDYGALTDNNGRTADFSNALIILTSNLGVAEMERGASGFARDDDVAGLAADAVRRFFPPEFRNRLDAVIRFRALSAATINRILDRRLDEIFGRLAARKGIRVGVSAKLRESLRRDGFSLAFGARPLERLLRERVLEPLALAAASGELAAGGRYRLDIDGDEGVLRSTARRRQKAPAPA